MRFIKKIIKLIISLIIFVVIIIVGAYGFLAVSFNTNVKTFNEITNMNVEEISNIKVALYNNDGEQKKYKNSDADIDYYKEFLTTCVFLEYDNSLESKIETERVFYNKDNRELFKITNSDSSGTVLIYNNKTYVSSFATTFSQKAYTWYFYMLKPDFDSFLNSNFFY